MTNIEVYGEDIGKRLDVFLSEREDITRAFAQKLIEDGGVLVLGVKKNKNYKIRMGDEISVEYPPPRECEAAAEDIPVDIVYEDEDIIVVNKPRGMVVHPAAGNYSGTLVNALMFHRGEALSDIGVCKIVGDGTVPPTASTTETGHYTVITQMSGVANSVFENSVVIKTKTNLPKNVNVLVKSDSPMIYKLVGTSTLEPVKKSIPAENLGLMSIK
jgi:ribosomal 50S subunit-recycling heat shock protein